MTTQAFKKLVAALEAGYFESKKQQDHFFKVLNGQNEEVKKQVKELFLKHGEIKLSDEQQEQGRKWLVNLWQTPTGKERKNNPFGYWEQGIIDNFNYAALIGYYDAGNYGRTWYSPLYIVWDYEGDCFEYAMVGGDIKILG